MRERLIELIESRTCRNNFCQPSCENCENVPLQDIEVERLADYLLANGVIVPPCKVGDKIYYIDKYTNCVEEDTVKFFTVTKDGIKPILEFHNTKFWKYYKWGKTVFLTKEEAENALKERERE